MSATYRAIEVTQPRKFSDMRRPVQEPGSGQVRIRVEACGVCHSDAATVEGAFAGIAYPRVPGHEVVGRIDAIGSGVQGWTVGQRVGVGFLAGFCGYCEFCRSGDLVNCKNQEYTGVHHDGGYADMMIAKASGLVSVPNDLSSADAAPLLCAGLTTFSALRNSPAKAGDLVAILGIGGLGHLGVQYARHMGFEVAAIARGADKGALAKKLGAHHFIDSAATDAGSALRALGGAKVILVTASGGKVAAETLRLTPRRCFDPAWRRARSGRSLQHAPDLWKPAARGGADRRSRDGRHDASLQRAQRRVGDDRNSPVRAGSGRLREDDVRKSAISHGSADVVSRA
jgi:propanol-preferring alcohol dehydrogenase